jgi:hypothetical protein
LKIKHIFPVGADWFNDKKHPFPVGVPLNQSISIVRILPEALVTTAWDET